MNITDLISAHEDRLLAAMLNGDVPELELLIHDDLIFANFQGLLFTKQMDLDAYRSGTLVVTDIRVYDRTIAEHDDCAVATVLLQLAGAYNGNDFNQRVRFIRTWKRFPDGWRVVAGASIAAGD